VLKNWSRRRVTSAFHTFWMMALVLGIVSVAAAVVDDRSTTRLVTDFMTLCVLVIALQSFIGNSGIVSFGHVAFFGIGAYAAALLTITPKIKAIALPSLPVYIQQMQVGFTVAVLMGACLSLLVAIITGLALSRMAEGAMAMATLALLVMLHSIFANWEPVTRGTIGVYGIPRNITLFNTWICAVVVGGAALLFKASPTGLCLQASRDDPLATGTLGVSVAKTRFAGWVLSAILMGSGGAMWAQNNLAFGPNQFYYAETFNLLSMLVIGGICSVTGAIAGVAVVTLVGELLRGLENGLSIGTWVTLPELPGIVQMSIACLIIVVLIIRPQGILGLNELSDFVFKRRMTKKKT
jgi:branched-chain amino acid transport system permease protein